jgi:hypothetical protein
LRLGYGDREYNLFGNVAKLIEGPQPPRNEVPESDADLFPSGPGFRFKSDTPAQRLAWTRGLTAMRKQMTDGVQARLAIGGRLSKFAGLYPGIVEEAWMSLVRGQPLYLVAAFGGAAGAVVEALAGNDTRIQKACGSVASRQDVIGLAKERGVEIIDADSEKQFADLDLAGKLLTGDEIAQDIVRLGQQGLSAALNNGLSDEENRELFRSTDAARISELILRGLSQC